MGHYFTAPEVWSTGRVGNETGRELDLFTHRIELSAGTISTFSVKYARCTFILEKKTKIVLLHVNLFSLYSSAMAFFFLFLSFAQGV